MSGSANIVVTPDYVELGDGRSEPFSSETKAAVRDRNKKPDVRVHVRKEQFAALKGLWEKLNQRYMLLHSLCLPARLGFPEWRVLWLPLNSDSA